MWKFEWNAFLHLELADINHANWHLSSFSTQNGSDCEQVVF